MSFLPRRTVDLTEPQPTLVARALYAGDIWTGQPYILVTEKGISLNGDLDKGLVTDPEFGTLLSGRLSLQESPDRISFAGGYWRLNPTLLAAVGSSAALPVPWLVHDVPELLKAAEAVRSAVTKLEEAVF